MEYMMSIRGNQGLAQRMVIRLTTRLIRSISAFSQFPALVINEPVKGCGGVIWALWNAPSVPVRWNRFHCLSECVGCKRGEPASMNRCFEQCKDIIARRIGGETILIPKVRSADVQRDIYALNPMASYVWGKIDGKKTMGAICDLIVSEFEVDHREAEEDLRKCIDQLLQIKGISEAGRREASGSRPDITSGA